MQRNSNIKSYCSLPVIGFMMAFASADGYTGTMGPVVAPHGSLYFGAFGGGGTSNNVRISQYGTAFITEAAGGPLAVNALGHADSRSAGIVGGHVGYQWAEILSNPLNASWGIVPAFELEGYYLGKSSFITHDINNDTSRLIEHDFLLTLPTNAGVFLANAVISINPEQSKFHPYVGAGIGAAVVSVSDAYSLQVSPAEPGLNHFNSNPSDTEATFAAQAKVGLNYEFNQNVSIFAEYRWLYLANTSFQFGSTIYPGHSATSAWKLEMDSQNYNLGAVGLRYTI